MTPTDPEAYGWPEIFPSPVGGQEPKQEDLSSHPDLTPEGATYYNPRTQITWVYTNHRWVKHDDHG